MAAPWSSHFSAVLRIIRYVKGTLFHGLRFSANSSLVLSGYSDADWAGDPTDRRSTTWYCFFLGSSLFSCVAKSKQLLLVQAQNLNIVLLLMLLLSYFGYDGC